MSFITNNDVVGKVYAAGWFLASEDCTRKTYQAAAADGVSDNGGKYIPMGTLYSITTGEGASAVTDYIGFVYEDVDVTSGNMPCSVVTAGTVYENRLPATLSDAAKTALEAKGFKFITEPSVTRPDDV